MTHYMFKFFNIGFWFFIPFIFISKADIDPMPWALNHDYDRVDSSKADEAFGRLMDGKVTYENVVGYTQKGMPYTSVSLKFTDENGDGDQRMEFLIKEMNSQQGLRTGEYRLPDHINGFLNNYEGVFGYADITFFGEEPLFTEKGKLVITEIDQCELKGYLNVVFRDLKGKEVLVKGDFHAVNATIE